MNNNNSLSKFVLVLMITIIFFIPAFIPFSNAELTDSDFSDLSYTDPEGDQYTYYRKEDSETGDLAESYGVKGKSSKTFGVGTSCIDITKLSAVLNSGTVTITLELAGIVLYGGSLIYKIYFVKSTHQHPDELVDTDKFIETMLMKFTGEGTIFGMELEDDDSGNVYAWSHPSLSSSTADVDENIITFTVSTSDLESVGVTTGSGFGLYATCALHGLSFSEAGFSESFSISKQSVNW